MLSELAEKIITQARQRGLTVATVESCTGGLIFAALTDVEGASAVMDRGFVTYSNQAKQEMVAVAPRIIETSGAVSQACAAAMATGGLRASGCDIALSVTGIAGPTGGSPEKPVGLVWMSVAKKQGPVQTQKFLFSGSRAEIRQAAILQGLNMILSCLCPQQN